MNHSVISFSVILLLLTYNLLGCDSVIVTALSLIASAVTIGQFLWTIHHDVQEKHNLEKRYLTSSKSVRDNYLRDMNANLRVRFKEPSERVKAEENFIEVDRFISDIEQFYGDMQRYNESIVSHSHNGSFKKIQSEAEANLSNDANRPIGRMRSIYQHVNATNEFSIYKSLEHRLQNAFLNTCSNEDDMTSAQKYILDYLNLVTAAGAKVFLTVHIASEILKTITNDSYISVVEETNKELNNRDTEMIRKYIKLLKNASREVWRCDPSSHVEDVTYTKLNNVFNIFITNEKDLAWNDECRNECGTLNPRSWNPCLDTIRGAYCPGSLWNCKHIKEMNLNLALEICPLDPNSTRRYDYAKFVKNVWVGSELPVPYGQRKNCDDHRIEYLSLTYKWFKKCDVCTCTSDDAKEYNKTDPRRTERFLYAKPVYADVSNNYVLTGVHIVKKDGIIFFEIQQGHLSTLNTIEPSSVSWKTVEQDDLYNPSNLIKIHWHQRRIELQDIDVPYGHVLVGLQIDVMEGRIVLKVLSLPMKFVNVRANFTNKVDNITARTITALSKTGLNLEDHHLPDPKVKSDMVITDKYLDFSTSSMSQDVGQTTIPLLDIQNVTTTTPTPMSGAGFYFKFTENHAGYLGIKLKTYDFTQQSSP